MGFQSGDPTATVAILYPAAKVSQRIAYTITPHNRMPGEFSRRSHFECGLRRIVSVAIDELMIVHTTIIETY